MAGRISDWLRGLRGDPQPAGRAGSDPDRKPSPKTSSTTSQQAQDIELLSTQLRRIGVLDARPAQADPVWLAALDRLWQAGAQDLAVRLGTALAAALPDDPALALRVAGWLHHQGSAEAALSLLDRILQAPPAPQSSRAAGTLQSPTIPTEPEAPDSVAQRARWLRSEVRLRRGDTAGSQADLADLLIADWPAAAGSPSAPALVRYRRGKQTTAAPRRLPEPVGSGQVLQGAAPTLVGEAMPARYRLLRELGAGGNGVVYAVEDAQLGCELALKHFFPQVAAAQVLDEAKLLSALQHPGVIALYDCDDGGRFLTMELCRGGSLRARLRRETLSLQVALHRVHELCAALCAVHSVGIYHGDIKPENLLFRARPISLRPLGCDPDDGDLVISDFGIAERVSERGSLGKGPARGTRAYLAPERLHGQPGSPKADLYAVGVVLFEMLSGAVPSPAIGQAPTPAELAALPAPATVHALLCDLLAGDPAQRPSAAQAVAVIDRLLTTQAMV